MPDNAPRLPFRRPPTRPLAAALLVACLLGGCATGGTPSTAGSYLDDASLTTKVKLALFNEPDLKSADIKVETTAGVVELSGRVRDQASIDKAITAARRVAGVRAIRNELRLK